MADLKRCPNCGGKPIVKQILGAYRVYCSNPLCCQKTKWHDELELAKADWNRRAEGWDGKDEA